MQVQLKRKKYGLVWNKESTKEIVVERCEKEIPVLEFASKKAVKNGKLNNILISGDNFHALSTLKYIYQNEIDVIYIDPPYNTGHEDFCYNDNYVNFFLQRFDRIAILN